MSIRSLEGCVGVALVLCFVGCGDETSGAGGTSVASSATSASGTGGAGGAGQGGAGATGGAGQGGAGGTCATTLSSDAACNACLGANCCADALACQADPNMCAAANACASACAECQFPICDSGFSFTLAAACANCLGTSCCDEAKACAGVPECGQCIGQDDMQACDATMLDEALLDCSKGSCATDCPSL